MDSLLSWLVSTELKCVCAALNILAGFRGSESSQAKEKKQPSPQGQAWSLSTFNFFFVYLVVPAAAVYYAPLIRKAISRRVNKSNNDREAHCMTDLDQSWRSRLPTWLLSSSPPRSAALANLCSAHNGNLQQSLDVLMQFSFLYPAELRACVRACPENILEIFF